MFVLQELRKTYPGLPVIAMADADKSDDVWEAMRQGAEGFLVKPLTAALVQHKCRTLFVERDTPD